MLCVYLYSLHNSIKGNKPGDINIVHVSWYHSSPFFYFYISSFLFTASTPEETTPSQTVKAICHIMLVVTRKKEQATLCTV